MTIKYECCYCHQIFPAKESIDGYKKGYKVGFLCPKCGKNIKADFGAKQRVSTEQIKWLVITIVLLIPLELTRNSEIDFSLIGIKIDLHVFLFSSWVIYIALLLILKPSLRESTILTDQVNET